MTTSSSLQTATLHIRTDSPIGHISPRLYGHFAEHLGRCCYDGLWVGPDSEVPNTDGFRNDVLTALRELPVPLLRWPGGCYADHYHWRDGIGPERMTRLGISCGLQVSDTNALGTHEFLRLCELIGAEPYLAGNVGSGTVQELCDWMEYCNGAADTSLTRERAVNGRAEPWNVRLWGVGNESWDCGGRFAPETYAHEYRRYASMLRHVDPTAELVMVGLEDEGCFQAGMDREWNRKALETLGWSLPLVDHLSIHHYWTHGGPETDFGEEEYYALIREAEATEGNITRTADVIARVTGGRRRIGIALDEWGVWHPEARPWGPGEVTRRDPITYEQANTLRDALAAGAMLEVLHRQCRVLSMANLAQIVNVLQAVVLTQGTRAIRTPTYHVLGLHKPHIGAEALPVKVGGGEQLPDGSPAVTATASRNAEGFAVTLLNRHLFRPALVRLPFAEPSVRQAHLLTADQPNAQNTFEEPERVSPVPLEVGRERDGTRSVHLPPHSLATVVFGPGGEG